MGTELLIPSLVMQQLQIYASEATDEIGGLGRISISDGNSLTLTEVFLIEQEASAVECDIDSDGVAKLYQELIDTGKDTDDIKCWWHSHANMGVCFSGTDRKTIKEWPGEWLVALVINKRGEFLAEFNTKHPIVIEHKLTVVELSDSHPEADRFREEVKTKVRSKKYVHEYNTGHVYHRGQNRPQQAYPGGRHGYWDGYGYGYFDDDDFDNIPSHKGNQKAISSRGEDWKRKNPFLSIHAPELVGKGYNDLDESELGILEALTPRLSKETISEIWDELMSNDVDQGPNPSITSIP